MSKEIFISINKPCSEDWNSFAKTKDGGYCSQCQKSVIDFTGKTESDVFNYFSKHGSNSCGRFKKIQLNKVYKNQTEGLSRVAILTAGILAFMNSKDGYAQSNPAKQKVEQTNENSKEKMISSTKEKQFVISGHVITDDSTSIPGINVIIKETTYVTVTDADGNFNLTYKGKTDDSITLVFSFIGFIDVEKTVPLNKDSVETGTIFLELDKKALEEVVVGGVCWVKKWSPRWIWGKVKGVFRSY